MGQVTAERSRSSAPGTHGLRGRSAELGRVLDALRSVQHGRPSMVLVRGEPGIGKTALVDAALEQAGRLEKAWGSLMKHLGYELVT